MPPNATLVKVMYNSKELNEVDLEWQVQNEQEGGWTAFILEHQWVSDRRGRKARTAYSNKETEEKMDPPIWNSTNIEDPEARSYTIGKLTPTLTYQFRIKLVNYHTIGHPSASKSPGIVGEGSEDSVVRYRIQMSRDRG